MAHAPAAPALSPKSCPRCGCHMRAHFECGCGAVHSDYCTNCGRFTDLPDDAYAELSDPDVPCTAGQQIHVHTDEEKVGRLDAHMRRIKKMSYAETREWIMGLRGISEETRRGFLDQLRVTIDGKG